MKENNIGTIIKNNMIKYMNDKKYNSYFNLQLYYLVKNIKFNVNYSCLNNVSVNIYSIYNSPPIINVFINNNYVCNDFELLGKKILKTIIHKLTNFDEYYFDIICISLGLQSISNYNIKIAFTGIPEQFIEYKNWDGQFYIINCDNIINNFELMNVKYIEYWMFEYKKIGINKLKDDLKDFNLTRKNNYTIDDFKLFNKLNSLFNIISEENYKYYIKLKKILYRYLMCMLNDVDIFNYYNYSNLEEELKELDIRYIELILKSLSDEQIIYLINNNDLNDISYLKCLNNHTKKKILEKSNLLFNDKIKLTNMIE